MSLFNRWVLLLLLAASLSCGGGSGMSNGSNPGNPAVPQFSHVMIVVEENHSFSSVVGNSVMPYLNSLASKYGLATNYFANVHPSLPNYFVLTLGNSITTDDNFNGVVNQNTVVDALKAAGLSWKCYAESLPNPGYLGADTQMYVHRHNPFAYFGSVQNDPSEAANMVPFPQLAADLGANQLPSYSFIVPNVQDDAHDCPGGGNNCSDNDKLAAADAWLSANIGPVINSGTFQQSGLMIIVFDEGGQGDNANGGGQVAMLVISSKSKPGFRSTTFYQHQSTLRLMLQALGVSDLPGFSADATQMGEFFQ